MKPGVVLDTAFRQPYTCRVRLPVTQPASTMHSKSPTIVDQTVQHLYCDDN